MKKIAFITGASGAVGSAAARALAAEGCDICAGFNTDSAAAESLADELCKKYGVRAEAVHIDLANIASIDRSVQECREKLGAPDILINNGGSSYTGLFQDMTDEQLCDIVSADMTGAMLLTKRIIPNMLHEHCGYIVNVSSVWGEVGASCEVAYSAAKAGLIGFTKALAKECAPSGVLVNCVSPGFVDTKMNSHLTDDEQLELIGDIPCCRAGSPEDIANAIAFLVSGKADYICGQVLRIDGGWI